MINYELFSFIKNITTDRKNSNLGSQFSSKISIASKISIERFINILNFYFRRGEKKRKKNCINDQ